MSDSLWPHGRYSPPGSSVHRILKARTLEWVAMPSSRGSSQHRDWTCVSYVSALGGRFFTTGATWEALFSQPQSIAVGSWRKIRSMPLFVFLKVKEFSFYSGETGWGGTTFPPLVSLLPQLKGWCNQTQFWMINLTTESGKGDEGKE